MKVISIQYKRHDLCELQRASFKDHHPEFEYLVARNCDGTVKCDIEVPCHENNRENRWPKVMFRLQTYLLNMFPDGDIMIVEGDMILTRPIPKKLLEEGFRKTWGKREWPGIVCLPSNQRHIIGPLNDEHAKKLTHLHNMKIIRADEFMLEYIGVDNEEIFIHWNTADRGTMDGKFAQARRELYLQFAEQYNLKTPSQNKVSLVHELGCSKDGTEQCEDCRTNYVFRLNMRWTYPNLKYPWKWDKYCPFKITFGVEDDNTPTIGEEIQSDITCSTCSKSN